MQSHIEIDDTLRTLLAQSGFEITKLQRERDGSFAVRLKTKDRPSRIRLIEAKQTIIIDNRRLELTPVTYAIAKSLIEAEGTIVKDETLIRRVWGKITPAAKNRLSVHMHHLRRALADHGAPQSIRNVHGLGFYLA